MEYPFVSICMITYNHEQFVEQAIDSILAQQTKYSFELLISDDSSKDGTVAICKKLASKNPGKIRILESEINIGMMPNFIKALNQCTGKYIALCEGDDYWKETTKLEQSVLVLEGHPEFTIACHANYKLIKGKLLKDNTSNITASGTYKLEDYLSHPFFHTSSIVFRRLDLIPELPGWYKDVFAGDNFLVAFLGSKGDIYYSNKFMSVYRVHQSSISNRYGITNMKKNYSRHMELFNKMSDYKYKECIKKLIKKWEVLTFCYEKKYTKKIFYLFTNFSQIFRVYKSPKIKMSLILRYLIPSSFFK